MRRLATAVAGFVAAGSASAQEATVPPPTAAARPAAPAFCTGKAAIFSDRKTKLFLTRRGTVLEDNPLRPLSSEPLIVFDVVVNGRAATVVGADPETLHRGPAPSTLEEQNKNKIAWTGSVETLPSSFRIVSEDGAIQSTYAFVECGEAPKVATVAPKAAGARRAARPGGTPARGETVAPRGLSIPQGAVPEGGTIR